MGLLIDIVTQIINDSRNNKFDLLDIYLDENIILKSILGINNYIGKAEVIDAIKSFAESCKVEKLELSKLNQKIINNMAHVSYDFDMHFTINGSEYNKQGIDIWTFNKINNEWKIILKTFHRG